MEGANADFLYTPRAPLFTLFSYCSFSPIYVRVRNVLFSVCLSFFSNLGEKRMGPCMKQEDLFGCSCFFLGKTRDGVGFLCYCWFSFSGVNII